MIGHRVERREFLVGVASALLAAVSVFVQTCTAETDGRLPPDVAWRVSVGGRSVPVIETPMPENCLPVPERHPYHYVSFVCTDETEVTVEGPKLAAPMTFRLRPGSHRVIDPTGRRGALIVAANPLDRSAPKPGEPGVRYWSGPLA